MSFVSFFGDLPKSFKKADDYTNLVSLVLSTINIVMSYFLESWRPVFLPILVTFTIFFLIMRIKIIHEEDLVKGFKNRMILWFGLLLLGFVPLISYFGLPAIENILRTFFGPPLYEVATPEQLSQIPSWHHGWSYFDSLFYIPLVIQFIIPYMLTKQIGKKLSSNTCKDNDELGLILSNINKKTNYFSNNEKWSLMVLFLIFSTSSFLGFLIKNFYKALLSGALDPFFIGSIFMLTAYSPMFFIFLTILYYLRLSLKKQFTIREKILLLSLVAFNAIYFIFFSDILVLVMSFLI